MYKSIALVSGMSLFVCSGTLGLVVFAGLFKLLTSIGE